jgi:hypothetical protein
MSNRDRPVRDYWDANTEKVVTHLKAIFEEEAKRRSEPFPGVSAASEFAAKQLAKKMPEKKKPIVSSTLRRNPNYRPILEAHIKNSKPLELTSSERLKLQVEIRNQKKLVKELEMQVQTALEDRSRAESKLATNMVHTGAQETVENSFSTWKRVIDKLLREIEQSHFDIQRRTVEDPIENKTLLKEKDFPEGFFDWLKRNSK